MIGVRGLAKWLTSNQNIDIGFGQRPGRRVRRHLPREGHRDRRRMPLRPRCSGWCWRAPCSAVTCAPSAITRRRRSTPGCRSARTKIWVYTLSGLFTGFAGVLYAAENHQGNPNAGVAYELDAIAAVVIGGTRLSGGKGSISGTIVGTLIMGVLTNMLRLNNVDSNVEMMIKAVIIVLAVAVQRERNGQ